MSKPESGQDGVYRMVIEDRYKKIAGVRRDAKLFAVLGGLYGIFKLGLTSVPYFVYGEQVDALYATSVGAVLVTFIIFSVASGSGKPHKESGILLWLYVILAATFGTLALLDGWNGPVARALLLLKKPPQLAPYDQSVAKLLVQKLNVAPEAAINDVNIINFVTNVFGAFTLLASAAATVKYLGLKKQPAKVKLAKKSS